MPKMLWGLSRATQIAKEVKLDKLTPVAGRFEVIATSPS